MALYEVEAMAVGAESIIAFSSCLHTAIPLHLFTLLLHCSSFILRLKIKSACYGRLVATKSGE